MPTIHVKTLGCKVNTYDSHALANQLADRGFQLVSDAAAADVTVVNTCSVTANADREARYLARRFKRENPDGMVVFTGCYAQTDSVALAAMDEIDLVIPNAVKHGIADLVDAGYAARLQGATAAKLPEGLAPVERNRQSHFKSSHVLFSRADSTRTRAFVKIQDGCNGFCAYCLIPYARGASRSVPWADALGEVRRLVAAGVPEIVLTGIHLGDYGRDLPEVGTDEPLAAFVAEILALPGLGRLRLSSLEPNELTPALVRVLAANRDRVCDHLHLPLQSGSDRILKLMRRTYTSAEYRAAVDLFREHFPGGSVSADVIPGFPGETAADFDDTCAFIETIRLSGLHVFPYSVRPNTAAARMPDHLPVTEIRERARRLRELGARLHRDYAGGFLGRRVPVLWEDEVDDQGRRLGHAANYLQVAAASGQGALDRQPAAGEITDALVKGFIDQNRLLVRIVPTGTVPGF